MEGETNGKMGGALGIFRGASCFSHPLLPPSEIGKAWLATPRLRLRFSRVGAAADRREVGASSSGVLPHHAGVQIAGLGARHGAVAPFLGRSPASFSPALSPPLLPQPPTRDGAMCGVESPRWERYCDAAFPGRSAKPLGVWGRRGEGGGSPTGRGKGFATGGDPGTRELGKGSCSRRGDTGRFSAALHSQRGPGFSPPARAESSFRPGGDWGRERLPLRAAPFCAPRTKASKRSGSATWGSAPVGGGHRLGHEGAASWSRQGQGNRPSCVCWRARAGRASGLKLPVAAATCPPHLGKNNNALSRACVYVCGT